jgi:hypothetical protein
MVTGIKNPNSDLDGENCFQQRFEENKILTIFSKSKVSRKPKT